MFMGRIGWRLKADPFFAEYVGIYVFDQVTIGPTCPEWGLCSHQTAFRAVFGKAETDTA